MKLRRATTTERSLLEAGLRRWHRPQLPGGLPARKHLRPYMFNRDQLAIGTKVEKEHTRRPALALEIAMAHLSEDPAYYAKLERTESTMGLSGSGRGQPVRIQTRKLAFGIKSKRFVCAIDVDGIELQNKKDPQRTAVVHRSTKKPGMWQTSYFDERGASGDTQRSSCTEALQNTPPGEWRLREVKRRG